MIKQDRRHPAGWETIAHGTWLQGDKESAIAQLLAAINKRGEKKPLPLVIQLAYDIASIGEYAGAAMFLGIARADYPDNEELLLNLGVCLTLSGQHEKSIECANKLLTISPNNFAALDSLAHSLQKVGQLSAATEAGTKSLALKDQMNADPIKGWTLPADSPVKWITAKKNVISFSLWGHNPRYLRGAIDNVLAAPAIYPGWALRFYVDDSVPTDMTNALESLGAEVQLEKPDSSLVERLGWRFKVADDQKVGRFLVRDVDSVINARESRAVAQWVESDKWFHVMRDWWTHTDLILAGMWGGVAGVLPHMASMLSTYSPSKMETPNIDQLFLREKVWPFVRVSCLIHDRCFTPPGAIPWEKTQTEDTTHVGQDVYAAHRPAQEQRLAQWISKLVSLS